MFKRKKRTVTSQTTSQTDPDRARRDKQQLHQIAEAVLTEAGYPEQPKSVLCIFASDVLPHWGVTRNKLRASTSNILNIFCPDEYSRDNGNKLCGQCYTALVHAYKQVIGQEAAERLIKLEYNRNGWAFVRLYMPDQLTLNKLHEALATPNR